MLFFSFILVCVHKFTHFMFVLITVFQQINEESTNKSKQNTLNATSLNNEHSTQKVNTNTFVSNCIMPSWKNTLVQTCIVLDCTGNKTKVTRVIFNQGSKGCFIKDILDKSLQLKSIRNRKLLFFAFDAEKPIC